MRAGRLPRDDVAVLNVVTEHADHWAGGRKVGTQEERDGRRFESILTGERDGMKQAALALANGAEP